jgi:amino acid adenylation domain-containing protein
MDPTKHLEQQAEQMTSPGEGESFAFPVSFAQGRLWLLSKLIPDPSVYNIPAAVRLQGRLDVEGLRASFDAVLARHEVLRASFQEEDGSPVQVIPPAVAFDIPLVDYSKFPHEDALRRALSLLQESAATGFDLSKGPLLRASIVKLADQDHVLILTIHHIIYDAWSRGILWRDLSEHYRSWCTGKAPDLPDLEIQYTDFSVWQREYLSGEVLEEQLQFWKRHLAGAPASLELHTDRPRPALQTFNGTSYGDVVPKPVLDGLKELSRREGATLFMTLLAAFNVLLARYSRQEDIVVGSPIAGRNRAEVENLIGFFVNTLPLRTDLSGNPTFRQLLSRVRDAALGAYAHQELPFEKLVEELKLSREISHHPVFQVMFTLQNVSQQKPDFPGLSIEPFHAGKRTTAKFDLLLTASEGPNGLALAFEYNTDLFESQTIERMARAFRVLLAAAAENANRPIYELPLMEALDRKQLLVDFNSTKKAYSDEICVHQLVEAQVERTPLAVALSYNDEQLTYAQLNERSNQLAHYFRTVGVGPESAVAVCMERSLDLIVSVLAILKSGAAYVPVDPEYPRDRVAFMLEDSQAALVVTQERLRSELDFGEARVLCVDSAWNEIAVHSRENPANVANTENLVYVIYTSGSTGKPKGVCLPHRSLSNLLQWQQENSCAGVGDRTLQFTSLSFDVSFQEIFSTLTTGGTLVLVSESTRRDGRTLLDYLREHAIARLFQPFVALQQLAETADDEQALPTSLREVITAGEQLKITQQIAGFFRRLPNCKLFNHYGPSETHVVTSYELSGNTSTWETLPPIGKPIANTQIYILASNLNPVPLGVSGELYIGGVSLATGYLRRPDLTEQRFVPNPFGNPNERLYKTGDLCRYLPDGNIQYLGRIDNQVKFRGYRIELGEIESVLAKHGGVQQSAVILREDAPGDKRLVAYVVAKPGQPVNAGEIRDHLRQTLPDYMVPATLVELDALPLTPSGKLDRKALPIPEYGLERRGELVAPRNPTEEIIAGIWAHVLKTAQLGIHDNFFELGGHSLLAMQVISRVSRAFSVDLRLLALFEAPTVAGLAEKVNALHAGKSAVHSLPLERIPRTQPLQLSFAQQRLWFLDRLETPSALYNVPMVLRLRGPLNLRALRNSLNRILARHESLRTWFMTEAGTPVQMITPSLEVDLRVSSVMSVPERVRETEARRLIRAEATSPFDLSTGPLIRVLLVKIGENDHVLAINTHHITSDRWSLGILREELVQFYEQEIEGEITELPPLPVQYADYAAWQRQLLSGEALAEQLRYWKQNLAGAPASLDLPTDRPRPAEQSYRGAGRSLEMPQDLTQKLLALGRREGTTLFMTLLASLDILLSRYSGQDDVVVGSPIAGRSRPEIDKVIGFFLNTLVLRTKVVETENFRQLLAEVRETAMGAYAHQDVPFEKLVEELKPERDLSRNPLFQVMFTAQNAASMKATMGGLEISGMPGSSTTSKFDLTVAASERESGLWVGFEYATDLFDAETIEQMQQHWLTLLQAIVANPDCPIGELPLLSAPEQDKIVHQWNATEREFARDICVPALVARHATGTPDAIALEMGAEKLTYAELNARAERLAQHLRTKGLLPEALVGIYLERSIDMVVALLGVLKAGGAYVPLDPAYPADRIQFIAEDAQIGFLITQSELANKVPTTGAAVIDIRRALESSDDSPAQLPQPRPEHLAYVLYTSGSTGKPKGVQITHANLVNFLLSMQREPGFASSDTLLAVTTLSFDIAGLEIYLPLVSGGRVVLASREDASDARALQYLLELHHPTVMQATPATWRMLIESGWDGAPGLKVLCGGEALPADLATQLIPRCGELWNMYGPTETTIWSSVHRVRDVSGTTPIGRPIDNTTFYILDSRQRPVPIGVAGELYIGGDGVARGYFKRPELTAERFISDPFSNKPGARMYRTGDLVRYSREGVVQYLGRTDFQVKVRGFRIELGEIESQLAKHPAVQQAVVAAREDVPGDKRLVAYVVTKPNEHLTIAECRTYLKQSLPDYMVPSAVVELGALPLTPNGKVDRKALPRPSIATGEAAGPVMAPRDVVEEKLLAIWRRVLKNSTTGVTDNFFDLGGHSLMAAQLVAEIENSLGRRVPMAVLFRGATVAEMAEVLRDGNDSLVEPIAMKIQPGRTAPFFAVVAPDMDAIGYAALAQTMGPQQTFYKLQTHHAVKPDAPITLDEMRAIARDYVQAMRTVQPKGPYYLGGMCAGTHIGEQMILQLEAEGERVALFAIFDTWVRQNSHVRWKWRMSYYRQRLRGMMRMSRRAQLKIIGDALSKKLQRAATLQKAVETSWTKLYWPGKDFKVPQFQAPVALFKRPRQPFYYIKDETMGWGERSLGGVHIYRIEFPHQMLREPYIREVAKRLLECISRATPAAVERLQVWPRVSEPTPSTMDVEV